MQLVAGPPLEAEAAPPLRSLQGWAFGAAVDSEC